MNKDTIYIEPENDITDIIAKIKGSKQKIVALVPPKKSSVLRSTINMKLITKSAKEFEKTVVLVTNDPSIMKLAMGAKILVAENLQSPPSIPTMEDIKSKTDDKEEAVAEEFTKAPEPADKVIKSSDLDENEDEEKDDEEDKVTKKDKKDKKGKKEPKIPSLDKYRKKIIVGVVLAVLIIGALVWAFVFAPRADIVVSIRTTSNNFSEGVSFTNKKDEENGKDGKFLLEEQKYSDESEVEFTATGKKDIGVKAKGEVIISARVTFGQSVSIAAGTAITYNDLVFYTNKDLVFDFSSLSELTNCDSYGDNYCVKSASVGATAAEPGEKYNIDSGKSFSSDNKSINGITNSSAFAGGTSNVITVVQALDIEAAKNKLGMDSEKDGKKKLYSKISDGNYIIEDSYKHEVSDPVSSIGVGEEVKEGSKPVLKASSTFFVYTIDTVRIEEFIKHKTNLPEDQKIYSIGEPFIEQFSGVEAPAKLKTTYRIGPKITEEFILEKSIGKKIGEVQTYIKSINGVRDAKVNPSFFWVRKIPTDTNKITITIKEE